jgi:hypothetical protein
MPSTRQDPAHAHSPTTGRHAPRVRRWFVVNAVVLWATLATDAVAILIDPPSMITADPGDFGYGRAEGPASVLSTLGDLASYFTTWSLLVAAVVTTLLAIDPAREGRVLRAARLASVLMLTVTVVATAIALPVWLSWGGVLAGWQVVLQVLRHAAAPLLTLVVWVVVGPRGWTDRSTTLWSLALPLGWIAWTLGRGAVVHAYPYDPVNVVALGYGPVLLNAVLAVLAGAVLLVLLVRLDRWLGRRADRCVAAPPQDARSAAP